MTKPWLGGCSLPEGREQQEGSRIKRAAQKTSPGDAERSTTRAVGQGHRHKAQVMHSQAFALGCTRVL